MENIVNLKKKLSKFLFVFPKTKLKRKILVCKKNQISASDDYEMDIFPQNNNNNFIETRLQDIIDK